MVCTITTSSSVIRKAGGARARRNRGRRLFVMVVSSLRNGQHHALHSDDAFLMNRRTLAYGRHLLLSAHKSIGAHVCGADQFLLQYATQN